LLAEAYDDPRPIVMPKSGARRGGLFWARAQLCGEEESAALAARPLSDYSTARSASYGLI